MFNEWIMNGNSPPDSKNGNIAVYWNFILRLVVSERVSVVADLSGIYELF